MERQKTKSNRTNDFSILQQMLQNVEIIEINGSVVMK